MAIKEQFEKFKEFYQNSKWIKIIYFFLFTILVTAIISSQNLLFQNIIQDGISKKDIIAQKTLVVEDTKRTEQHKREVIQKLEPILAPAEDDFIKTNLQTLQNSILQIRKKHISEAEKTNEFSVRNDI